MMSTAEFYYKILLTVTLVTVVWTSCTNQIVCPCGKTRRAFYYTHCLNDTSEEEITCERWANCETCRASLTHCVTCPPGRTGPTCDEGKSKGATCPDPGIPDLGIRQINGTDDAIERIFSEGESIYFSCDESVAVLKGNSVITCTALGDWTDSLPRCEKIEKDHEIRETCADPGIPEGATREIINETNEATKRVFQVGESLYFYCNDEDSNLEGADVINCTSSGNWSDTLPRCQKDEKVSNVTVCPDPGIPDGGSRENYDGHEEKSPRTFQEGEMLYFYCDDEDSELIGEYIINCTSFGNWSNLLPTCQKTEEGEEDVQTCPDPGIPEGGGRRNSDGTEDETERAFKEGESAHFYCNDEDSVIAGAEVINCTTFGTWSHSLPRCEKKEKEGSCPDPGIPEEGGRRIFEGNEATEEPTFVEGVSVYFYCNNTQGYYIKGDTIITCTSFGNWSNSPPQCEKTEELANCPDPGLSVGVSRQTADGTVVASERVFQDGESLHFSCIEVDAVLHGDDVIFCTSIGTWSGSPARCEKTETVPLAVTVKSESCSDPGTPEGGSRQNAAGTEVVETRPFVEGESLYFYCKDEDSELKGDFHLTCTSNGWSGLLPHCEKTSAGPKPATGKPCKHPGDIANGLIENLEVTNSLAEKLQVFPSASRLKFHCKEGFRLEGANVLFCLCSGEWTSPPPTCVSEAVGQDGSSLSRCRNRGPISNGQVTQYREMDRQLSSFQEYIPFYSVGTRLHYYCNEGYALKGEKTIVCESSGLWSAKEPKCIRDGSLPDEGKEEDESEEPVRRKSSKRGSGKPNSLTFKFFFF